MADTSESLREASRYASRKFLLTLLLNVELTAAFSLKTIPVELWVGSLLSLATIYMLGNVGTWAVDAFRGKP